MRESAAGFRHAIQVRCLVVAAAITSQISPSQIIHHDHNDMGRAGPRSGQSERLISDQHPKQNDRQYRQGSRYHPLVP
jgi:hypothetical protein